MKTVKWIWIGGVALAAWGLHGDVFAEKAIRMLTLADAVELAQGQNLTLAQSAQQVALDEADATAARSASHPNLSVSLSPSQNFNRSLNLVTDQVDNQQSRSVRATASSSMVLYDGGANQAAYRAADRDLEASRETLVDTRRQVIYVAASEFLQVCQDVELLRVARENLTAQQDQLKRIGAFFEEGVRSRADVLQQQASVAQAELEVLSAERAWTVDQLRLKQTLRLEPSEAIAVLPPKAWADAALPANGTEEALALRADVAARTQQLAAAEWRIDAARAGYLPTLSLSGNLGTDYSSSNNLSGFQDQLLRVNPSFSVGFSLSFPILDRSRTRSNVERARVQRTQQELAMAQLKQTVAFEVEQAVVDYRSALKQRQVREATEAAAREALAAREARYDTGAATLAELSQSRATYVNASAGLVASRYEVMVRYLDVAQAQGRIETAVASLIGGM